MYEFSKDTIICPVCGKEAVLSSLRKYYKCKECGWVSYEKTVDIDIKDPDSALLSTLFPHDFIFYNYLLSNNVQDIHCLSMESFLQSLTVKDPEWQKYICEHYSGLEAQELATSLHDWRQDGYVYWNGRAIKRDSTAYSQLITTAFDCLFEGNPIFRQYVLPKFKDKHLIQSIGKDSKAETLLTESEFRYQLNRLIKRLDFIENNE